MGGGETDDTVLFIAIGLRKGYEGGGRADGGVEVGGGECWRRGFNVAYLL
jgi:hypothetical protein